MKVDEILVKGAEELGVTLTQEQVGLFLEYLESIKVWNKKINLTAIREERGIVINHFLDSISLVPFIIGGSNLLDIGSGAGFPGIPLKIVIPELEVTLLDSVEKKVFFMRYVIRRLRLKGIESVCGRAEDTGNGIPRGHFDLVVSRAVAEIRVLLKLSAPYINEKGKVVLMRGKRGFEEWEEVKKRDAQGFRLLESKRLFLPFTGHERVILVVASTPSYRAL